MALTNAERQRRYRERRDKDLHRRAEYLQKKRTKYLDDIAEGKRKLIKDLTEREKRSQRKKWKQCQRQHRKKKKTEKEMEPLTPPHSPEQSNHNHQRRSANSRAKCYRDNEKLRQQLKEMKQKKNMYMQRWLREKETNKDKKDSPRTKTKRLLRALIPKSQSQKRKLEKANVRKTLIFHYALNDALREKYMKGNNNMKRSLSSIVSADVLKKYKLVKTARQSMGVRNSKRYKKIYSLTKRLEESITAFYERDDNSRMTSGIKETVTRKKEKKQKRILHSSLTALHQKYVIETDTKISYASFCRRKPFWVVSPKESDRETCLCKIHENTQMIADSLHKYQVLKTKSLREYTKGVTCDINSIECMYGRCRECKDFNISLKDVDQNKEIELTQWVTKREKREIKGEEKEINITTKETIKRTIGDVVDKFKDQMTRFRIHSFNIGNQFAYYKRTKDNLKENEVLLHVDFSENFQTKMSREIQSMHFGASHRQVTLHTGVYYNGKNSIATSFCSVSDSLEHGPHAIWAHLDPVLDNIQKENDSIDTLHIFSDGPTAQYKQKGNFYLFSKVLLKRGLKLATWNFHEAGHGKGAPDGIGGAIKRAANKIILHGRDIMDAKSLKGAVEEEKINIVMFHISTESIMMMKEEIPALDSIPGTMKIHQLISVKDSEIFYRDVSRNCENLEPGTNGLKKHIFPQVSIQKLSGKSSIPQNTAIEENTGPAVSIKHNFSVHHNSGTVSQKPNESVQTITEEIIYESVKDMRTDFFDAALKSLESLRTFKEIRDFCIQNKGKIDLFAMTYNDHTVENTELQLDKDAMKILPDDYNPPATAYPVQVTGDGNCLPYSGSIIAFGKEDRGVEIRVRIVSELALHSDKYLDHSYLKRGLDDIINRRNLATTFAQYSDHYIPGTTLTTDATKDVFENEVVDISHDKTFMGIWQVFALSSVLHRPIKLVYPNLSNPNVRKDLNRVVMPRKNSGETNIAQIMWTSTRNDMVNSHWVPNHFVPILPMKDTKDENNNSGDDGPISTQQNKTNDNDCQNRSLNQANEKYNEEHRGFESTEELLNKYVAVLYENQAYPGYVVDTDHEDIFVRCMHRVGKDQFFWPRLIVDECWYSLDNVVCIIQEPEMTGSKYKIKGWDKIVNNIVSP